MARGLRRRVRFVKTRAMRHSPLHNGSHLISHGGDARPDILLLGGSAEGYAVAERLTAAGLRVLTSFAGATAARRAPAGAHRVGGFGGADGLADALRAMGGPVLLDATHPYAARMSANAAEAARAADVPSAHVWRPAWAPDPCDDWTDFAALEDAAQALPGDARVLLTTGRTGVDAFADRADAFWLRCVDPPDGPTPARLTVLRAKGPFRLEDERRWIAETRATHLVTKNSGGPAPKLQAAREAGLRLFVIARPAPPEGRLLTDAASAAAWALVAAASRRR